VRNSVDLLCHGGDREVAISQYVSNREVTRLESSNRAGRVVDRLLADLHKRGGDERDAKSQCISN